MPQQPSASGPRRSAGAFSAVLVPVFRPLHIQPAKIAGREGQAKSIRVLGLLSLAFGGMLPSAGCDRFKDPPPPAPQPPEVIVTAVMQRDVPVIGEWLGTADGLVNADVRSRVQGYVQSQAYTEGAVVKTGDLLYEIDPRPFEASLAQTKADLAKAQANLGRTQLDVERLTPLAPSGAVSQQEVDNARQDNAANKAAVAAAEAEVEQATLNLQYTHVLSPIDGVAGISQAQIGDLVGGPAGPVLTVVSTLDPIRIYFPISEQEYLKIAARINEGALPASEARVRTELDVILADGVVHPHKGVIDVVNRQVTSNTGTIKIGARFPNPGNTIRPGQYARIRAVTSTKIGALLIPQRCVIEVQGIRQVALVGADNKVSIRNVKAGERVGSDWVIDEGLSPGDRVVVEGLLKVKDGMTVTTKLFDPAAKPPAEAPTPAPPPKAH